jgi:hypothetical protein
VTGVGREDRGPVEEVVGLSRAGVEIILDILLGVVHGSVEVGSEREAVRGRWARVGRMGRRGARGGGSGSGSGSSSER